MRPQTIIDEIADDTVYRLLEELAIFRGISLDGRDTIFNFLRMIYDNFGKPGRIAIVRLPIATIAGSKVGTHENTTLHDLLESFLPAGGSLEFYKDKAVLYVLNDVFAKMHQLPKKRRSL